MSAGAFQLAKYQRNGGGTIHAISLQPETIAAEFNSVANAQPAGAIDSDFRAKVSRGNTECGLLPRKVNFKFSGTVPTGYKADQIISLAILQESVWNGISVGQAGTYLGEATIVISKSNEDAR